MNEDKSCVFGCLVVPFMLLAMLPFVIFIMLADGAICIYNRISNKIK